MPKYSANTCLAFWNVNAQIIRAAHISQELYIDVSISADLSSSTEPTAI